VSSIGTNFAGPSYLTSSVALPRWTVAVCGTLFAIRASRAGTVPATERASAFGLREDLREVRRQRVRGDEVPRAVEVGA
jgi:hypothetical protein